MVRVSGLRPGAERQPLRMKLLADGEHFLERVEQVRPLFDQRAPRGPHSRPVAGCVLPEHVAEGRHVLLVQRAVEGRVHGVWIGRALGVDVEHREAVIPVAEGDALDALECVVEIARLCGRRVDADADERVFAPRAEDVTVFGVVRRHVQPARGVIVVVPGTVQRVVKGQQRARLARALGNVHWVSLRSVCSVPGGRERLGIGGLGAHAREAADAPRERGDHVLRRVEHDADDVHALGAVGQAHAADDVLPRVVQQGVELRCALAVFHDDADQRNARFHARSPRFRFVYCTRKWAGTQCVPARFTRKILLICPACKTAWSYRAPGTRRSGRARPSSACRRRGCAGRPTTS